MRLSLASFLISGVRTLDTCVLFDEVQQYFACQDARTPLLDASGVCRAECSGSLGDLGFRTTPVDDLCVRYVQSTGYVAGSILVHSSSLYSLACLGQYEVSAAVNALRLAVAVALHIPLSEVVALYALGDESTEWSPALSHTRYTWQPPIARRLASSSATCSPACVMGTCVAGVCQCSAGYSGSYCQLEEPGASCTCDENVACWSRSNLGCCRTDSTISPNWCGCPGTTGGLVDQIGSLWTRSLWRPCSVTFWCQDESGTSAAKDVTVSGVSTLDACKQECLDTLSCAYFEFNKKFALCKISFSPKTGASFLDGTVEAGNWLCEPRLDPCSLVDGNFFGSFCGEHGQCRPLFNADSADPGQATCACRNGYSGAQCEVAPPADPCDVEPRCPGHTVCEARVVAVATEFGTSVAAWAQANRLCSCAVGWSGGSCDVKVNVSVRAVVEVDVIGGFSLGFLVFSVANRLVAWASEYTYLVSVAAASEDKASLTFLMLSGVGDPAEEVQLSFASKLALDPTVGGLVGNAKISAVVYLSSVPSFTKFPSSLDEISVSILVTTRRLKLQEISDILSETVFRWQAGLAVAFAVSGGVARVEAGGLETPVSGNFLDRDDFKRKTVTTTTAAPDGGDEEADSSGGVIIGGVAGGVASLVGIFLARKRRMRRRVQDISDVSSEDEFPRPGPRPVAQPSSPKPETYRKSLEPEETAEVAAELPSELTLRGISGRAKVDETEMRRELSAWRAKHGSRRAKRQLLAAWHPDRASEEQKSLATRTFQWLSELK